MTLPSGEPAAGPWEAISEAELIRIVFQASGKTSGRPWVVAVDGRSASGKTSLAARLARLVDRSAIVHTDDVAWNEPLFEWGDLLGDRILAPFRRGEGVAFSPPAWSRHGRPDAIEVPAGLDLVIVEGVGAARRELSHLVDAVIWVQADFPSAETRGPAVRGSDRGRARPPSACRLNGVIHRTDPVVAGVDLDVASTLGDQPVLIHLRRWRYQDILIRQGAATAVGAGVRLSIAASYDELDGLADRARAAGTASGDGPFDTAWNTRDLAVTSPQGLGITFTARRPEGMRDAVFTADMNRWSREQLPQK